MKKMIFAALAIAAMMVSCQKEALVDNQKETPAEEKNELQPVVLGSNLFKAAATKASVENIGDWRSEIENNHLIYVWALNNNDEVDNPVFIKDVPAKLAEATELTPDAGNCGSLDLTNPVGDKPFYYGTGDKDIYDFYAYYLGYVINEEAHDYYDGNTGVITVPEVTINGDNDIMIASTNKAADAIVEGKMVNPKYLYSEYSARHEVVPNLVFNHMLSKFSFNVRYAGPLAETDKIYLKKISLIGEKKTGRLVLNKVEGGDEPGLYIAAQENQGDVFNEFEEFELKKANDVPEQQYGYQAAGNLMVVPAGENSYKLKIDLKQTFNEDGTEFREYDNQVEITKAMVVTDDESEVPGFEAGKHYVVNITVYGLQAVVVNVQLVPWEDAGTITIDPDQKEDGIMQQVNATVTIDENNKNCVLYAETFEEGNDIFCMIGTDFTLAPIGVYTLTEESKIDTGIQSIEVTEVGKIASVAR